MSVHHSQGGEIRCQSIILARKDEPTPDYARSPTHRAERAGTAHTAPQSPSCRSGRTRPQASKRQELDWPAHSSASLADQMRSRLSMMAETGVRWWARSKPLIERPADRRVQAASLMVLTSWETTIHFSRAAWSRTSGSARVARPRSRSRANSMGRLAAQYAHDNRVVQIVIGQEVWPAHSAVEPGTLLSARRRCTTGLGFCAAC